MIKLKELKSLDEMLSSYELLLEVYPNLTMEEYKSELEQMIPNNYSQLVAVQDKEIIGLTGVWIGTKLWSGKYLEADNVVVSEKHRSKGIAKLLFDHIKEVAEREKCNIFALDTYTTNFKAHKFFYNQDMAPTGFHFVHFLNKEGIR